MTDRTATASARTRVNVAQSDEATRWMLDRRIAGWSIRKISEASEAALGQRYGINTVHKRIAKELAKIKDPLVETVREIELSRLDDLEERARELLEERGSSLAAMDRLLKIGERRAKLKGLDAPVQVQSEATVRYEIVGIDPEALR